MNRPVLPGLAEAAFRAFFADTTDRE